MFAGYNKGRGNIVKQIIIDPFGQHEPVEYERNRNQIIGNNPNNTKKNPPPHEISIPNSFDQNLNTSDNILNQNLEIPNFHQDNSPFFFDVHTTGNMFSDQESNISLFNPNVDFFTLDI